MDFVVLNMKNKSAARVKQLLELEQMKRLKGIEKLMNGCENSLSNTPEKTADGLLVLISGQLIRFGAVSFSLHSCFFYFKLYFLEVKHR